MLFCVCEGKIKDDCDLGIHWSPERPVHVTSSITRAESLLLIKFEVLIQKCRQSLCCLWWSGVLSYILLLLKASHMAEKKKFASHRSVLSKVFFCHVQFYSIRIISFPFLWKCFLKRQINRNGPCHPLTISPSVSMCVEMIWHSLYGGGGKDSFQVWGWTLFMGDKKSKLWEIGSQVFGLDQHIFVHLGQMTSASSLFRAEKEYSFSFSKNAQLIPACFLSSERCCGGCIKERDISLSSSSTGPGCS